MKLKQIQLYNFGSYEDSNLFDFAAENDQQRIIIIGGKNGAGKTTLFTAIQIGLYGHYAFGYKTAGRQYYNEISKLINNHASMDEQNKAFVRINFSHIQSTDCFDYDLTRTWQWNGDQISESLAILKDGILMEADEADTFQNLLLHLIPPDLLKLYFFDGEKIADYFLSEQKINIRDALMTLSGNDTFDILHNQVARILNQNNNKNSSTADSYLRAKAELEQLGIMVDEAKEEYQRLEAGQHALQEDYARYTEQYTKRGGLSLTEWKQLQTALKDEEKKREHLNWKRREFATDVLPFLMIKNLINEVPEQIKSEEDYFAYTILRDKMQDSFVQNVLSEALANIGVENEDQRNFVYNQLLSSFTDDKWQNFKPILQLSDDEKLETLSVIKRTNETNLKQFDIIQNELEASVHRSSIIRDRLAQSNAENIEQFLEQTKQFESQLLYGESSLEKGKNRIEELTQAHAEKQKEFNAFRKQYETELKKQSVTNISGKVLFLLEDLQQEIYCDLVQEVQYDLQLKWQQLIQKENFFDHIFIDEEFNVRVIRNQEVNIKDLKQIAKKHTPEYLKKKIGIAAYEELTLGFDYTKAELIDRIENISGSTITLPIEFDKNTMSSGEKQMFVMALYWALMQQSDNDLPFIIDTPFARIDEQHRANITEHFFKDLNGQLMVLSTNEEIDETHIAEMDSQIARIFTLEYNDSEKRTYIHGDQYFEG